MSPVPTPGTSPPVCALATAEIVCAPTVARLSPATALLDANPRTLTISPDPGRMAFACDAATCVNMSALAFDIMIYATATDLLKAIPARALSPVRAIIASPVAAANPSFAD